MLEPCFLPKNLAQEPTATPSADASSSTVSLLPSVHTAMMLSNGSSNCTLPHRPGAAFEPPAFTWMMRWFVTNSRRSLSWQKSNSCSPRCDRMSVAALRRATP
jgi:hypothetical protein